MNNENYGARWTPEHERELISMFKQGFSPNELAAHLGRTKGAILKRLYDKKLVEWDNNIKQFYKIVWLGK